MDLPDRALLFDSEVVEGAETPADVVAMAWDLDSARAAHEAFLEAFGSVAPTDQREAFALTHPPVARVAPPAERRSRPAPRAAPRQLARGGRRRPLPPPARRVGRRRHRLSTQNWSPVPSTRRRRRFLQGPERLLLGLGLIVGLAFVLCYPPYGAGADEGTHFARALEMAHDRITPGEVDGRIASPIPASYKRDQDAVVDNVFNGTAPFSGDLRDRLLESRPDWDDTFVVETQPTMAATPLAYAPSAVAMVVPDRLGWAGLWVLWAGRVGNLLVYLAVVLVALRVATAFRWSIVIAALFPMNLGIAASVSPDALTIAALMLVVAVWTRVWRPGGAASPVAADESAADESARTRAAVLSSLGASVDDGGAGPPVTAPPEPVADPGASMPADPGRTGVLDRLGRWVRTPVGTGAMVLVAGLLLVATKPPYFLVLVAFPALLVVRWADRCVAPPPERGWWRWSPAGSSPLSPARAATRR